VTAKNKRTWIVEVCKTCDRLAQWPFCDHRQQWLDENPVSQESTPSWYELVRVRETG
jgi:hypothetical protein